MSLFLIVSNPPHSAPDHRGVASLLGLTQAEARMKERFPAPEVWDVFEEREAAVAKGDALEELGLDITVVPASELGQIPEQSVAERFDFGDGRLAVHTPDGLVDVAFDEPLLCVLCSPPKGFGDRRARPRFADTLGKRSTSVFLDGTVAVDRRRQYTGVLDDLERATFVDLYVERGDELLRIAISSNITAWDGLGEAAKPRGQDNVLTFVEECGHLFDSVIVDRRMEGVRPRRRLSPGGEVPEGRALFSFGTTALNELLETVKPGLHNVTQYELGSRLAYLISEHE